MIGRKPDIGDLKYSGLSYEEKRRQVDRDAMNWEIANQLEKSNEIAEKQAKKMEFERLQRETSRYIDYDDYSSFSDNSQVHFEKYNSYSEPLYKSNLTYYSVMLISLNRVIAFIALVIMMIIVKINNYCILAIVLALTINVILRICIPVFESNAEKKQNLEETKKNKKVNSTSKKKRGETSQLTIVFDEDENENDDSNTKSKSDTKQTIAPEYIEGNLFKTVDDNEKHVNKNRVEETTQDEVDPLLIYAIKEIVESGEASTAFLQRKLKIGYARAGRIIDQLEEKKMITGYQGNKPRQILISKEEVNKMTTI